MMTGAEVFVLTSVGVPTLLVLCVAVVVIVGTFLYARNEKRNGKNQ